MGSHELLPDVAPNRSKRLWREFLSPKGSSDRPAASEDWAKDWPDAIVPGLALRVTEADHRSFVMIARYPLQPEESIVVAGSVTSVRSPWSKCAEGSAVA